MCLFPACRMKLLKECLDGSKFTAWDYVGLMCNLYIHPSAEVLCNLYIRPRKSGQNAAPTSKPLVPNPVPIQPPFSY